jgi:DNA replication protein DnaC
MSTPTDLQTIIAATRDSLEAIGPPEDPEIQRRVDAEAALTRCGLPMPYRKIKPLACGDYADTRSIKAVRRWIEARNAKPILVLGGPVGTGKTFAALAGIAMRRAGYFVRAADIARHVDPWTHEAGHKPILWSRFLVVDDLGTENADPRWLSCLDRLIDSRSEAGRTIITTNLQAAEARGRYGDRIWDRLRGRGYWIQVEGESLR